MIFQIISIVKGLGSVCREVCDFFSCINKIIDSLSAQRGNENVMGLDPWQMTFFRLTWRLLWHKVVIASSVSALKVF